MTPSSIYLVQRSWQQVLPLRKQAGRLFYDNLFAADPSLQALFKGDLAEQGRKLMDMIDAVVGRLDRPESLLPQVQALGRRHVDYGVTEAHYAVVGAALLKTLADGLGETFTEPVRTAWTQAYAMLAHAMQAAARPVQGPAGPRPEGTFIRVAEVWVPSADRTCLEFGGGLYGTAHRFGRVSRGMCFARGEGLPGRAWERGHPIVLQQLEDTQFRRGEAARDSGLTCGVAVPIFAGDFLTSVLVFFCSDDAAHAGALELWHNDPSASPDMTLQEGYYGTTAEAFGFISRHIAFRRGTGLPGSAWESGAPVFIEDLGRSARFLRADSATQVGINRGLAIPCPGPTEHSHVLAFLSALGTPIARRIEIWLSDAPRERLTRASGFCEVMGTLDDATAPTLERGQGTIGRLLLTGAPGLSDAAGAEPGGIGAQATAAGLHSLVAMPVINAGRLTAAVVWYF